MKIVKNSNKVSKFQAGGQMEAPMDPAMAPEAGGPAASGEDSLLMLAQGAAQALQTQDANLAMQVCEGLLQLVSQAMGPGPEAGAPQEAPVFKKGGILKKKSLMEKCGGKMKKSKKA